MNARCQKHIQQLQKIDKLDFIKIKNSYIKGHYQESKTTTTELRKYLQIISDKNLISRINKELLHLNNEKPNKSIKHWAKDVTRHFSKKGKQMNNKLLKTCSVSLVTT